MVVDRSLGERGAVELNGTVHIRVPDAGGLRANAAAIVRAVAEEALRRAGHADPEGMAAEVASALAVELGAEEPDVRGGEPQGDAAHG